MHLVDHGVVGVDILPQAFLCLAVEVDHLLDMHDIVLDEVDHIAAGLIFPVVVDGHVGVVLIPAPVFLPGQVIAEQAPVGDGGKVGMELMEIGVIPRYPADIARGLDFGGDLPVLDVERNFIGDDFPPEVMIQRDGVGVEQRERLALLIHPGQALDHQLFHDALPGVLRVGADTGDEADVVDFIVDVHFQRVDRELGDEGIAVKTAQHIGAFQHREFGLLDLIVFPACRRQFLLRHLKGVAEQGVILIQVVRFQIARGVMLCGVHGMIASFRSFTFPYFTQSVSYSMESAGASPLPSAVAVLSEAAGCSGVAGTFSTLGSAAIYTTMTLPASTLAPASALQETTHPDA